LCLRSCAGGVHNQLWQKSLWKENERNSKYAAHQNMRRVDYRATVSENT